MIYSVYGHSGEDLPTVPCYLSSPLPPVYWGEVPATFATREEAIAFRDGCAAGAEFHSSCYAFVVVGEGEPIPTFGEFTDCWPEESL